MVLGILGPGQLSNVLFSRRTIGPRGPSVRGPIVRPEKVDSWAPDSSALEQCINSTDICSPNISNTNIYIDVYITKCTFLNFVPEGRTETLQLTYIPQMLAAYIQYKYIHYKMYIPGCTETLQLTHFPNCWYDISNTNI